MKCARCKIRPRYVLPSTGKATSYCRPCSNRIVGEWRRIKRKKFPQDAYSWRGARDLRKAEGRDFKIYIRRDTV